MTCALYQFPKSEEEPSLLNAAMATSEASRMRS